MNFWKRYPGDYARDTAHLSLTQHGAYTLLLDHCYSTERPLPADDEALFRICRAFSEAEREAVKAVSDEFFPVGPDGLRHNTRADRQIPLDRRAIDAARENGKRGGRPITPIPKHTETQPVHVNGTGSKPDQNPVGSESITGSKPTSKTLPLPQEQEQEQRAKSIAQRAARFMDFWQVYPNRKGKAKALATWQRKGLDALADRIIADVKARISRDRQWIDGYVPHGSTYVNGRGWEDDIESTRQSSGGSSGYVPLPGEC